MKAGLLLISSGILLSGCTSPESPGGEPAPTWNVGDEWSWNVEIEGGSWRTTHTVVGTTSVRGQPVYAVLSTTTDPSSAPNRTLYFSKATLNLMVVGCDDPGERPICVFEEQELDFPLRENETWLFVTGDDTPTTHEVRATLTPEKLWRLDYVTTEYDCPTGCFFQVYDPAVRHLTYRETGPNTIFGLAPSIWRLEDVGHDGSGAVTSP